MAQTPPGIQSAPGAHGRHVYADFEMLFNACAIHSGLDPDVTHAIAGIGATLDGLAREDPMIIARHASKHTDASDLLRFGAALEKPLSRFSTAEIGMCHAASWRSHRNALSGKGTGARWRVCA
jgi:hypothetical protein